MDMRTRIENVATMGVHQLEGSACDRAGNNFPNVFVDTIHVHTTSYGTRSVPTTLGKSHTGN